MRVGPRASSESLTRDRPAGWQTTRMRSSGQIPVEPPRSAGGEFAHVVLRAIVRQAGGEITELTITGALDEVLRDAWDRMDLRSPSPLRFASDAPTACFSKAPKLTAVLVTLPEPRCDGEAYFVAITVGESCAPRSEAGYFVLDRTSDDSGEPGTVVIGWTGDARRLEYGAGPQPVPGAFLAAVARITEIGS